MQFKLKLYTHGSSLGPGDGGSTAKKIAEVTKVTNQQFKFTILVT